MVYVLRLGHRPERDKRVTTHVALTARAFGARGIAIWRPDASIKESVGKAVKSFGGNFEVLLLEAYREFLLQWSGPKVLLSMYGLDLDDGVAAVRSREIDLQGKAPASVESLVVVGAEKMPPFVFRTCDFSVSVGSQPHSEVAAVAMFLDRYFAGKAHRVEFPGARLKITPTAKSKKVTESGR